MPLSIESISSYLATFHLATAHLACSNYDSIRNIYIGGVSCFTIVLSFAMYGMAVQFGDTTCEKSLTIPIVSIIAVLILFSLITLIGLCFGLCFKACLKRLFGVFMVVMSVAIVLFVIVIVFFTVFTSDVDWLRKRFLDDRNRWNTIKSCFIHNNFCANIYTVYGTTPTLDELRVMPLSTIRSGCCKPAYECNFEYISPVEWIKPAGLVNSTNPDCQLWHNDPSSFCFDCLSCKDGFIQNLKDARRRLSLSHVGLLCPILMIYFTGRVMLLVCWPRKKKD